MGNAKMNPDLLKRLQVNGLGSLPWERTHCVRGRDGNNSSEEWEVVGGGMKLQAVAREHEYEPHGCKILSLTEHGGWEHIGGKALDWDDGPYHSFVEELEEKFWPAYRMHEAKQRNLPRLSHLPDDLRAVAVEFLNLHECWDTDFEVNQTFCLEISWSLPNQSARFEWMKRTYFGDGYEGEAWSLFWRVGENELRGRLSEQGKPRRSHDFAEFVRRFAE